MRQHTNCMKLTYHLPTGRCLGCGQPLGDYMVKCDDCKTVIRYTANVMDSYAGGRCAECVKL